MDAIVVDYELADVAVDLFVDDGVEGNSSDCEGQVGSSVEWETDPWSKVDDVELQRVREIFALSFLPWSLRSADPWCS